MNSDIANAGDLIRMIDPIWDWLKAGDIGVIVKRKKWSCTAEDGSRKPDRYTYRVRFALSNQTRIVNRHEFQVVSQAQTKTEV